MKALKVLLIIAGILLAAILIVPVFAPSTVVVTAEKEIGLSPEQIFPQVASFEGRANWDPWVSQDPTTDVDIVSKPGYVGSTYSWNGEQLGTGSMEVISVRENEYIESHLWFGETDDWSLVEWTFVPVEGATLVSWTFTEDTKYPFERLGMMFGARFLEMSFNSGLESLKELLESRPPKASPLGDISIETQAAFHAFVARGEGTMEEMTQTLGELFGMVYGEAGKQGLQPSGPAFVEYLSWDEEKGVSSYRAGVPVAVAGKDAGKVSAVSYPDLKVIQALHTGPYEKLRESYEAIDSYILEEGFEVKGSAFEFYRVSAQQESDPAQWKTLIAFPLK